MIEEFRDIPGYEGLYQVSNTGIVYSLIKNRIKIPNKNTRGYLDTGLWKNGKEKRLRVHRLVLLAFVGPSDLVVNHLDGNPLNNRLDNLEYCTQSENIQHAFRTGLSKVKPGSRNGEKARHVKLTEKEVLEIRNLIKTGLAYSKIAKKFGVSARNIGFIAKRETWNHLEERN